MNRFRTKKKAKETTESLSHPSNDYENPSPASSLKPSMTFKRGKKAMPEREEKMELDLANALPPADDFRTSLLMTGLSARFSMLREQDDPNSKIGKASDDSVLSLKRQSRLGNFGFQPSTLADIAEVASIKDSIRRPFALERTESYNSMEYGTEDDSTNGSGTLNRPKHGEGNNLFGGRQKIYRIPLSASASMKNLTDERAGMNGRALYVRDVSQSTFETIRNKEKAAIEHEQVIEEDNDNLSLPRRSESPSFPNYNRNRETSSTSSSGPSLTRSSTAATSVTSQRTPSMNGYSSPSTPAILSQSMQSPPERVTAKAKRLYETGLDQHLHNQQSTSINRLDGLSRQRTLGARPPSPNLSSPNGPTQDDPHVNTSLSQSNHQFTTPPQSTTNTGAFDFGIKPSASLQAPKLSYGVSPPLSPPMSEADEQSVLPIQPNDKGKATALGTFHKPISPYDENKYTQRQLQMQQGRETPPLRKPSPPRSFLANQHRFARSRADSQDTHSGNRSGSSLAIRDRLVQSRSLMDAAKQETLPSSPPPKPSETFLESPGGSSKESDLEPGQPWSQPTLSLQNRDHLETEELVLERPPESEHPAHRKSPPSLWIADSTGVEHNQISETSTSNDGTDSHQLQNEEHDLPADSPTLPPAANGLSGLVSHLRSDSNTSSIYAAPSPGVNSRFYAHDPMPELKYSTHGNPWAMDSFDSESYHRPESTSNPTPDFSGDAWNTVDRGEVTELPSWEKEMRSYHNRTGSSETQKERRDFAQELAERRKRVQENLRSFVESDSRAASPAPGIEPNKDGLGFKQSPLGILKSKPSRDSLVMKATTTKEGSSKAMKLLGIGQTTISASPNIDTQRANEHLWREEEEEMLRGVLVKSPRTGNDQIKAMRQARREAQRDRERQVMARYQDKERHGSAELDGSAPTASESPMRDREPCSEMHPIDTQPGPKNPGEQGSIGTSHGARAPSRESKQSVTTSTKSGESKPSRDRSNSEASERSKSHGRDRDDFANAMTEGVGTSTHGSFDGAASARSQGRSPGLAAPHQFPVLVGSSPHGISIGQSPAEQLQPIQPPSVLDIGLSPRPSPVTPFSVNSTPALTPTGSSINTLTPGFQSQGPLPPSLKRTVNKAKISDPVFVSTSSKITTITLNVAAAQQGTSHSAPPLPPMDPRRRQTRAQAMINILKGKGSESSPVTSPLPSNGNEEDRSVFSADEADEKPKPRQKLRKSSSDGANLNARAQRAFNATPSPPVPSHPFLTGPSTPVTAVHAIFPAGGGQAKPSIEGEMF